MPNDDIQELPQGALPPAIPPPMPAEVAPAAAPAQPIENTVGSLPSNQNIPPPRPPGTSSLGTYQGTRSQIFRGILGDFLYSAGKGLAAAGHGPEANYRGAGAAISALPERAIMQRELGIQQQQAESMQEYRKAQGEALTPSIKMLDPNGNEVLVPPAHVGQALAAQYRLAGQLGSAAIRSQTAENISDKQIAGRQTVAEINANLKAGKEPTDPVYQITKQLYPELDPKSKEFATAWEGLRMKEKTDPGVKRMMALVVERAKLTPFETVEPGTNVPKTISNYEAVNTGAPKVPLATQGKMSGQWALYNDAYGILDNINGLANKVNLDDKGVASRVAAGYAAIKDPATNGLSGEILSNMLARQPINNQLSPDERQLVLTMAQGKAAATGLRSILGQAGYNEMQQRLDSGLMPGPQGAASKAALKQQVGAMRQMLDRFSPGLPQVGLNAPGTPTAVTKGGGRAAAGSPPENLLKEGMITHFKNGQDWTLKNGKAVQVGTK